MVVDVSDDHDSMTVREVAAAFGVTVTTVHHWANAGLLRHFRTIGGHRRFLRADVQHLVEATNLTVGPPATVPRPVESGFDRELRLAREREGLA